MMWYRLKDGRIFDERENYEIYNIAGDYFVSTITGKAIKIIIQSENIFDLIQDGDLVNYHNKFIGQEIIQVSNDYNNLNSLIKKNIFEIYTKQGDNYCLVWRKEEKK